MCPAAVKRGKVEPLARKRTQDWPRIHQGKAKATSERTFSAASGDYDRSRAQRLSPATLERWRKLQVKTARRPRDAGCLTAAGKRHARLERPRHQHLSHGGRLARHRVEPAALLLGYGKPTCREEAQHVFEEAFPADGGHKAGVPVPLGREVRVCEVAAPAACGEDATAALKRALDHNHAGAHLGGCDGGGEA